MAALPTKVQVKNQALSRNERADDIARLKVELRLPNLEYVDISAQLELSRALKRWPLLDRSRDWLLKANNQGPGSAQQKSAGNPAASRVEVSAKGPIAAIVGLQSPFHEQRSIIALLATEDADFQLLRETLNDSGKMDAVAGSVVLIRSSGVQSQMVGDHYYVGSLPWWLMLWFKLSEHPILLAILAVSGVLLTAFLTWRVLHWAARRRLAYEE